MSTTPSTTPDMIDPARPKPGSAEGMGPFDPRQPRSRKLGPVTRPLGTAPAAAPRRRRAARSADPGATPPDGHPPRLEEIME